MDKRTTNKRTAIIVGAAAALTLCGAGTAIAVGGDDDAGEKSITGASLDKAKDAALAETGGGTVTATEVDDEESKYEVEVTENGHQVDVQLDENFEVVGTKGEDGAEDD
jgi:uncharacterized membrane protein YkoI